ncbi:hypothetical protein GTW40_02160 [Streptomyces sp. SID4985]|nr:hypothetical protein [Streptomyces sp. SID4985]
MSSSARSRISSPPFFVSKHLVRAAGPSPSLPGETFPGEGETFPEGNGEIADDLRSYESTRCLPWPANSFMVSVTDPGGAGGGVLRALHVKNTRMNRLCRRRDEEENRSWTSFAPPAGRRRSPPRPSTPAPCRSRAAPM